MGSPAFAGGEQGQPAEGAIEDEKPEEEEETWKKKCVKETKGRIFFLHIKVFPSGISIQKVVLGHESRVWQVGSTERKRHRIYF